MRTRVAVLLFLSLAAPSLAQSTSVVVREKLDPPSGAVVGQPVRLLVDVLFPDTMPRPPRVSVPDTPGTQIMRFESQGVTMRDQIGGQNYVGQQFEFIVFPRRGGAFTLPPASITLLDPSGDTTGSAKGEPLTLDVAVPPGIEASGPVIASTKVTASESWNPDPSAQRKPGDAIVRTITREAADVPALGMADFAFPAPDGVRVYVDAPVSDDRLNRGAVTGRRVDKVTYVFEKAGSFELPAIAQPWWDLGSKAARSERLAGVTVRVAAPPPSAQPGTRHRAPWGVVVAASLAAAAFAAALLALWPRAREAWREHARRRAASEASARNRLREAAQTGDASSTYAALREWTARLSSKKTAWVSTSEPLRSLIAQLEGSLFGDDGAPWTREQGKRLSAAVSSVPSDRSDALPAPVLPPLNPGRAT